MNGQFGLQWDKNNYLCNVVTPTNTVCKTQIGAFAPNIPLLTCTNNGDGVNCTLNGTNFPVPAPLPNPGTTDGNGSKKLTPLTKSLLYTDKQLVATFSIT